VTEYRVRHETTYHYGAPVVTSQNEAHLLPRKLARQTPADVELRIDPTPDSIGWRRDYFGNDVIFFDVVEPHERLVVAATSRVQVEAWSPPPAAQSPAWEEVVHMVRTDRSDDILDAYQYVFDSTFVHASAALADYARASFGARRPLLAAVFELNERIHRDFHYDADATTVATPIEDVLAERHGVCQDFAHVMIGCLRSIGLPARYVSGYLRTGCRNGDGAADRELSLIGADASHAWVSAFCPGVGWFDVDPTNALVVSDAHVVVAWGRDYDDVSPVKGVTLGGAEHSMKVAVEVVALTS
jgi:transglutaminase-like putative cysteine protease